MTSERKLKIYLSYTAEDTPVVQEIYERLLTGGFLPWMHKTDLEPGQEWELAMKQAMFESDVIIACLSNSSYRKEGYIQTEYKTIEKIALEKPKGVVFLIPLRLHQCDIPDIFRPYQWLDYFDENGYERLIQGLSKRAQQLGLSVSPSTPSESVRQGNINSASTVINDASTRVKDQISRSESSERNNSLQDLRRGSVAISNSSEDALNSVDSKILGTGFILNDNLVCTCAHVLGSFDQNTVFASFFADGNREYGTVLYSNKETDVAILSINTISKGATKLLLGESRDSEGHSASVYGFPYAENGTGKYTQGKITGLVKNKQGLTVLQIQNAILEPGMSGGAVLDEENNLVVGMIFSYIEEKGERFEQAIPAERIQKMLVDNNLVPVSPETIRPYTFENNALDKHVATDKPIQSIRQDKLDFKIYVNAFHSFILSKYTTTPITISIDGVWGTGKSSLMSMLKGKLDPQRDGVRKFFEWVMTFLPWWQWFFWFLLMAPVKLFGKTMVAISVRDDHDDNEKENKLQDAKEKVRLYFGEKYPKFRTFISNIVEGFATDPEILTQQDGEKLSDAVHWWVLVNSKCEPMQPHYHYAVWLNAWKFDNQEEVWASLALATMEQIKQKHGLLWRLSFWWDLTFSRFSFWPAIWQVVKQFLLPLIFAIVLASYTTIIGSFDKPLEAFVNYGSPLLWAGFVISGILAVSSIFKDPFQIPLEKVFDRPNYKDKVKFLSHFEKDFARIVRAATKNGLGWKPSKLVIFIDDLDRCEPPKSADIVEAVNLFLDAEGCVFVIGMDSESVSKSVEVKYKDLFERMKAENTGVVSLGRSFLDKIVQIPFSVPRATPDQITQMVEDMIGAKSQPLSLPKTPITGQETLIDYSGDPNVSGGKNRTGFQTQAGVSFVQTKQPDVASYAKPEVQAAIIAGTKLLADNPRQVKTFINLFRLSIYIANERGILEEKITAEQTSGLNLEKLAMWIACSVRWQSLVRHFHTDSQIDSMRDFLYFISNEIQPNFNWLEPGNVPAKVKKRYLQLREEEKGSEAHWCYIPWEWWLLEQDFLKAVKSLQDLWRRPTAADETDWLKSLLTMTRPIN